MTMRQLQGLVLRRAILAGLLLCLLPHRSVLASELELQSLTLSGNRGPRPASGGAQTIAEQVGIDQKLDAQVPLDARFLDESSQEAPLSAYFGARPVILVPAYYRCPILCSQVLGGLAGSLKGMSLDVGKDFQVIVLSFDPTDTPAAAAQEKGRVVRRYHRKGTESGWHFLSGQPGEITRVMQSIGYRYSYDAASREYAHPAGIVVLTPAGRVARYFVGIDIAPRDLRLSLVQASAGKIGTPIDKLLLFCYRYDPASSKLGARVMGALQIGGALAVLGLAALLLSLWYRDSAQGRKSRDSDRTPAALESGRFSDIDEEALADEDFIDDEEEEQWRRLHRRPQERTS